MPGRVGHDPSVVSRARLLQATGLFHLTFTASQLIGLVVLGPLRAKWAGSMAVRLSMAPRSFCAAHWSGPASTRGPAIRRPHAGEEAVRGVARDIQDIWQFVVRDRIVALSMVQWTIGAILGLVVATLVPGFAERLLHVNAEDAVFVMAPAGIGMVAGTAVLNRWGDRFEKHLIERGIFMVAICIGVIGGLAFVVDSVTSGNPPLIELPTLGEVSVLVPPIMGLALAAGFGFVAIMVPAQTYLQERAGRIARAGVCGAVDAVELREHRPATAARRVADLIGVDKTLVLIGLLIALAAAISVSAGAVASAADPGAAGQWLDILCVWRNSRALVLEPVDRHG